jgi:hypothetical protein
VEADVRNQGDATAEFTLAARLLDPAGRPVGDEWTAAAAVAPGAEVPVTLRRAVAAPRAWSAETPHRYRLVLTLRDGRGAAVQISTPTQEGRALLASIPGAWVEDKELTLSVHYRRVAAGERLRVRHAFYQVVRSSQEQRRIRVTAGKEVFELRPPVRWTKGTMLSWLLTRQRALAGRASVLPVCLGDDATDEDAFEALGDRGITVAVGPSTPLTRARYRVESPEDVQRLLQLILSARTRRPRHHVGSSA